MDIHFWIYHEDLWFFAISYLRFILPINFWKKYINLRLFSKGLVESFLRPLRSKDVQGWILIFQSQKLLANSERLLPTSKCKANGSKVQIYCIAIKELLWGRISEVGSILFIVCKKCWGCNLKIQPWTSLDLNGLKTSLPNVLKKPKINAFTVKS